MALLSVRVLVPVTNTDLMAEHHSMNHRNQQLIKLSYNRSCGCLTALERPPAIG
jgi:hypothetical protein